MDKNTEQCVLQWGLSIEMKLCYVLTVLWSSDDDRQLWVEANTGDILSMTLQSLNTGLILQHRQQNNKFVCLKKRLKTYSVWIPIFFYMIIIIKVNDYF